MLLPHTAEHGSGRRRSSSRWYTPDVFGHVDGVPGCCGSGMVPLPPSFSRVTVSYIVADQLSFSFDPGLSGKMHLSLIGVIRSFVFQGRYFPDWRYTIWAIQILFWRVGSVPQQVLVHLSALRRNQRFLNPGGGDGAPSRRDGKQFMAVVTSIDPTARANAVWAAPVPRPPVTACTPETARRTRATIGA